MDGMEIVLPGGLSDNGCIEPRVRFSPLTGRIEQALIELETDLDRSGYVTVVLDTVLQSIGNEPTDKKRVADLCVADRQYLMLRLAAILDGEQMWLKAACSDCHAPFDVDIRRCDLPVKKAGQSYPLVTVQLKQGLIEVRVPTGADQERIAKLSQKEAMLQLLQCCTCSVDGKPQTKDFINNLSASDIEIIDQALDEASPSVCNQLLVTCPECGREQQAELDHYALSGMNGNYFYDEVHALASHYHWSEAAILDLPQSRRHRYLNMINRSTGTTEQG